MLKSPTPNPSSMRYDRLKAISAFGYDIHWEDLFETTVSIPGVGGLGVLSAEMLVRCGVGTLHLFDLDVVEMVNLNRLGFNPADIGRPKVEVLTERLQNINPNVSIIAHHGDIMNFELEEVFDKAISESDIVLMGLDNYPARMFTNQKCINHATPLLDAGVARSALSGYIHLIRPFQNACMMCRARMRGTNETLDRGLRCTASLPSTMALIASIQVQESLKYLLKFGKNIDYQTYNAITGDFQNYSTQRDKNCSACGN